MANHDRSNLQIVAGLILLAIGVWAAVDVLELDLPGLEETWPAIPTFGGLVLIAGYFLGRRRQDRWMLVPGTGCLLVGGFFFLITLGPFYWSDMERLWPFFVTAVGLVFLVRFAASWATGWGWLIPGVGLLLLGIFFFLFTIGPLAWYEMDVWWPVFPLIVGLAFLAAWGAARWPVELLIPAGVFLGAGVLGLALTFGKIDWIANGWPVVLILLGLWMIVHSLIGRRKKVGQTSE